MKRFALALPGLVVVGLALAAPPPELAGHEAGRRVWLGTCQVCHGEPDSGAPQLGDAAAWAPRLGQGRASLYRHALEGFVNPASGGEMPPRGANPALSDEAVRSAVDYMLAASVRP